jgi:DMSO/TMAO reductase YedYZ molybdopterin-dependent catalytic subunit
MKVLLALLAVLCTLVSPVEAGDTLPFLTIDGETASPRTLSEAEFKALPRTAVRVKDRSGKEHSYEGVSLGYLLGLAGVPLKQNLKHGEVAKFLHAQGRDGYAAVFALPEFDRQDYLVADTADGKALEPGTGPLQIVLPAEPRRSRWVKQLVLLRIVRSREVRF